MTREHFIFYRSFYEAINMLPSENQLQVYRAVMEYALNGEILEVDTVTSAFFTLIRPQIDANNKRYVNGGKGAGHGKKGGAPKGNQNARKTTNQPQNNPKTTPNVNVNDNDNVNVNKSTVVDNARMSFCETYGIATDAKPPPDIDFEKLSEAYSESKSFLQNRAFAKRLSWIVNNYSKIIAGDYKDFQPTTSSPTPTKYDFKSIDHLFVEISEDNT